MTTYLKKVIFLFSIICMVIYISNINLKDIKAETLLKSSEITLEGYQIKEEASDMNISFRTIFKAPNKGSKISINGKNYTVQNFGLSYTLDSNKSGDKKDNILDDTYTFLNTTPASVLGLHSDFKYVGSKGDGNKVITFGYLAGSQGIYKQTDGYTYYKRTLTNMDKYVANSLHIRGFVEAVDSLGQMVLIYSNNENYVSIAEIAYKVYVPGKASNETAHKYLYNSILNKLPKNNRFYLNTEIDYGWSGVVD